MENEKKRILVSTSSYGKADSAPLDFLCEKFDVVLNPFGRKLTTEEFIELADGICGVLAGVENITRRALISRPNIKVISRCGVGMDNVDLEACKELGVKVYNTPFAPVDSVAEYTLTLMLDLLKKISQMDVAMKNGKWSKMTGFMLGGKRIGIVGMGRIGTRVAELLRAFGVEIAYSDLEKKENGYTFMPLDDLLAWADVITIHAAATGGRTIIGTDEIGKMQPTAYLINTARGQFVDEDALYSALNEKRISGAALDVFHVEPYDGRLRELQNVILTPHIASSAKEGRAKMEMEAAHNLVIGLEDIAS